MVKWKRDLDDFRAVAITEEGDRLTVESLSPERCWWAVRLWDSAGPGPDREGFENFVEDAKRMAEATQEEAGHCTAGEAAEVTDDDEARNR